MAKHDWEYKRWPPAGETFWVVCADCGKGDRSYKDEELARARVRALRLGLASHGATHNYGYPTTGPARRARKARARAR